MAGTAGELKFRVGADTSGLKQSLDSGLAGVAKKAAAAVIGLVAIKKALDAFGASVKLAEFADTTTVKLAAAFQRAGVDARAATDDFVAFAGEMQNITGIADEVFQRAGELGASFGITGEALKDTTRAASDMAAVMGSDLTAVMAMITRSVDSGANAMKRYGIEMDVTDDKGQRLNSILENIQEKFGGAAQATLETYGTRTAILSENWGDLQEEIGRVSTQSKTLNALLELAVPIIMDMSKSVKENRGALESWISGGISIAATAATVFATSIGGIGMAFQVVKIVINKAIAFIVDELGRLVGGIQTILKAMAAVSRFTGGDFMADQFEKAADAVGSFKDGVSGVADVFESSAVDAEVAMIKIGEQTDAAKQKIVDLAAAVTDAAAKIRTLPDPSGGGGGAAKAADGGGGGMSAEALQFALSESFKLAAVKARIAEERAISEIRFQEAIAKYDADVSAHARAEDAKATALEMATQRMVQGLATVVQGGLAGTMTLSKAWDTMRDSAIDAVRDIAMNSIRAYAASSAAATFFSQAGIPIIGPALAVAASSAAFALVKGFMGKFHDGGFVGGGGKREGFGLLEKGEFVFDRDTVKTLGRTTLAGIQQQPELFASGGSGGGMVVHQNFSSLVPVHRAEVMRGIREVAKMQDQLERRGFGDG